jgi:hypothetical protein
MMEANGKPHFPIILPLLLIRQVGRQTPKVSLKQDRKRQKSALIGPES